MEYLSPERVELQYRMPLAEVVIDFFDQLKSRTQGYASLDYEPIGYDAGRPGEGRHPARTASRSTRSARSCTGQGRRVRQEDDREAARRSSRASSSTCRSRPPSAAGSSPARPCKAFRKDVTAKLYGGDITRKKQAAREAEGGQEAHEEPRPGRDPLRRLHLAPSASTTDRTTPRCWHSRRLRASRSARHSAFDRECHDASTTGSPRSCGRRPAVHRDGPAGGVVDAWLPSAEVGGLLGDGPQRHARTSRARATWSSPTPAPGGSPPRRATASSSTI